MSLPSNVSFMMQSLANYSRNVIRMEPNAANTLSTVGNSMVSVNLATNSVVNLKSFCMHADCSTEGIPASAGATYSEVYALLTSIPDALHRISWQAGGMSLTNSTGNYNVIKRMKDNVEMGIQKFMSDSRVSSRAAIEKYSELRAQTAGTQENTKQGQAAHLTCSHWLGFTEAAPQYLPTSILPELRFTAQMSSETGFIPMQFRDTALGDRTPKEANANYPATKPKYIMNNIYFTIEVISLNGVLQELAAQRLAEAGSIRIPYKEFQIFSNSNDGAAGSCRGSISTQSLDRVYSFMRSGASTPAGYEPAHDVYTQAQPPVKVDGSPSYSCVPAAFNFTGYNVATSKLKILNSPYPLFDPTIYDNFVALQAAEDRCCDGQRGGLIGSASQWENNAWVNLVQLCHSKNVRLVSGLDLSSVNGSLTFDVSKASLPYDWKRLHHIMTESTSVLTVGGGRSVAITS